jgi:hypothetical protein
VEIRLFDENNIKILGITASADCKNGSKYWRKTAKKNSG